MFIKVTVFKFNINSYGNLAYINIFAPGQKPGKDKPLFVGSTVGFSGEVTLPVMVIILFKFIK